MSSEAIATEGHVLDEAHHTFTTTDLFLFSAAGWHPHRVHYDQDYTRDVEGHPDLLVHGPLQAVHMVQNLTRQLPPGARLEQVEYRHQATLLVGVPATMGGTVTSVDPAEGIAVVSVWIRPSEAERATTLGTCTVRTRAGLGTDEREAARAA